MQTQLEPWKVLIRKEKKEKVEKSERTLVKKSFGKRMLGVHKLMLYNAQIGISNASDS